MMADDHSISDGSMRTDWDGCWRHHLGCAVAMVHRLIGLVDDIETDRDRYRDLFKKANDLKRCYREDVNDWHHWCCEEAKDGSPAILDWITPCKGYALRIAAEAWRQIDRECSRSGTVETGGVLVGHYSNDQATALVTEALPPPKDSARGASWFHRGVVDLRALLAERWKSQLRTYYIGEWHYHPASVVEPSGDDLAQMHAISVDPRYRCQEPVMMIVGNGAESGARPVRAFVFPQGVPFIEFEECGRR